MGFVKIQLKGEDTLRAGFYNRKKVKTGRKTANF